jgi:hypothetical protein
MAIFDVLLTGNLFQGQTMYKVRWVGYGPSNDTYEPYDNLLSCVDMIEEFVNQQKEQKKKREEEKKKVCLYLSKNEHCASQHTIN